MRIQNQISVSRHLGPYPQVGGSGSGRVPWVGYAPFPPSTRRDRRIRFVSLKPSGQKIDLLEKPLRIKDTEDSKDPVLTKKCNMM